MKNANFAILLSCHQLRVPQPLFLHRPVAAGPVEATALGNVLIQLRTLGALPQGVSLREVSARSGNVRTYTPDGKVL